MEKTESLVELARRAQELSADAAPDLCGEALQILYRLDLSHAEENAFFHYSPRVEPCFEELSWLCDETHPSAYMRYGALKAAVRADPPWAADIVRWIASTTLAGDDTRRTELVCGVIDELHAMIVDLYRQEKTIR